MFGRDNTCAVAGGFIIDVDMFRVCLFVCISCEDDRFVRCIYAWRGILLHGVILISCFFLISLGRRVESLYGHSEVFGIDLLCYLLSY